MKKINSLYIIDDDKIYHFLLKNLLKQNGINVSTSFFSNGAEALDQLRQCEDENLLPDLILLDVNMPIMDGWQFLEEFKNFKEKLSKETIIYMISSSNDEVDISKAKGFGEVVKDYFLKPICREDLNKIFI